METKSVLSERLKAYRGLNELSQRDLAEKLEIPLSRYRKIEENPDEMTLAIMKKLAAIYQISIGRLLTENADPQITELQQMLLQSEKIMPTFNEPPIPIGTSAPLILTKEENNRVQMVRTFSKEDRHEVDDLLTRLYRQSRDKENK